MCRRYIQRFPNGETHPGKTWVPLAEHIGQRRAPGELKHLSTPRKRNDSLSSGERKGTSLNRRRLVACKPIRRWGCKAQSAELQLCQRVTNLVSSRTLLEWTAKEGDSPVNERVETRFGDLEYHGTGYSCGKQGRPLSKAKHF